MADKNVVLSGKYKGQEIKKEKNLAYISGVWKDFSKDNVLSYTNVDQRSGSALTGAVLAGTEGAIIASNSKTYLVEIVWTDGDVSLIKVTPDIFEAIVATTYNSETPPEEVKRIGEESQRSSSVMTFIIASIWILLYLCGNT